MQPCTANHMREYRTCLPSTAAAVPDIRQARARALCVAGGALAAAIAWTVEVPLLGIDLNFRYGTSHTQIVAGGPGHRRQPWPPCCSAGCCSRYWSSVLRTSGPCGPAWRWSGLAASAGATADHRDHRRNRRLGRRRPCRDAPDDRGHRDPRHGAHGAGALTAHQEASGLTLNGDAKTPITQICATAALSYSKPASTQNGGYLRAAAAPRASAVSQSPPRKLITQRDFAPALQLLRRGRLAAAAPGPGRRVAELGSRAPRETAC